MNRPLRRHLRHPEHEPRHYGRSQRRALMRVKLLCGTWMWASDSPIAESVEDVTCERCLERVDASGAREDS